MTVADIKKMNSVEYFQWQVFFQKKARDEKKAMEKANRKRHTPRKR